ncbi:MAG: hypothetical protein JW785_01435 [Acidimicrobiia bacterium]|nr:hypothetical protein [Acidimicrobiia bacterium]
MSWQAFVPADGATAVYEAVTFDGRTVQLPARFDYAAEWQGSTWMRLQFGTVEVGQDGAAMYFDIPEPWMMRWAGAESTQAVTDFVQVEYPAEPVVFDFLKLPGETIYLETDIVGDYGDFTATMGLTLAMSLAALVESIEVPAGAFDALHLEMVAGGELIGGLIDTEWWLAPDGFFVKWEEPPGFRSLQLVEGWSG